MWCARNEGFPPPEIDAALRTLLAELEPTRLYQPSSTDGAGVRSHGPYYWRTPREFYMVTDDYFKTETGSVSVPTLESIHGMMPKKDWETINDDWAEHDLAKGNSARRHYPGQTCRALRRRSRNLADFVRKAQLANYEAFRAMYEGRNAQLFHPTTAVITWMSNPAQPSFVWQIYHYDLEPSLALRRDARVGTRAHPVQRGHRRRAGDQQHARADRRLRAHVAVYNLDGSLADEHETKVTAAPDVATDLGPIDFPASLSPVHFIKLDLRDAAGKLISTNFYWRAQPAASRRPRPL